MYEAICILQLPVSYCVSLNMVTITRHVFITISQTEHISAVKFAMGCEKKYELYAGFRLTCRLPHCRFDDDISSTAQASLAAEG